MVVLSWIVVVVTGFAAWHDLRTREIPDTASIVVLVAAVAAGFVSHEPTWLSRVGGLGIGFACGAALFALGAWGGGDAKLVSAVGAYLGVGGTLDALVWMGIAGFVLSVIALARRRREVVYGPAITAGAWVVLLPSLLSV